MAASVDDVGTFEHVLFFAHEFLPLADTGMLQVGHHQTGLGCPVVGVDDYLVGVIVDGIVLIVHIGRHLDELRVGLAQVAHKEIVAGSRSALVKIHDGLLLVDADVVETLRLGGILVEQHILALGRAHLVVVYFLHLVDVRELLALFGGIVGTIVETVAQPRGT